MMRMLELRLSMIAVLLLGCMQVHADEGSDLILIQKSFKDVQMQKSDWKPALRLQAPAMRCAGPATQLNQALRNARSPV